MIDYILNIFNIFRLLKQMFAIFLTSKIPKIRDF